MNKYLPLTLTAAFLSLSVVALPAADVKETLTFHTEWKGERITLPPAFAPAMTLKGIEEIRFAPGMFDPKADSFFTYAFVFSIPKAQELTPEVIKQEMLAYYRGLAASLFKRKDRSVDTAKFTFALEPAKEAADSPKKIPVTTKVTQSSGELSWIEPFATGEPQVLQFELQSWSDPATARNYLFVCVTPKARAEADATWKSLREIRRTFEVSAP